MIGKTYWFDKNLQKVVEYRPTYQEVNAPNVIEDTMPACEHPCNGHMYDSKRAFREVTRAYGCIETGDEKLSQKPERPFQNIPKDQIREAINRSLDIYGHRRD